MSDLLNQASLVMVPSGYKEDTVYSVVPSDGSGDLSFTRASNGTRINSAGLVEVVPWNYKSYSEDLTNGVGLQASTITTITANTTDTTDPFGTNKAEKFDGNSGELADTYNPIPENSVITSSIYAKAGSVSTFILRLSASFGTTAQATFDLSSGTITATSGDVYLNSTITPLGNGWYRCSITYNFISVPTNRILLNANGSLYFFGWQLNIGSTAKPYFLTTDRLNVPRLTYQNGGGGCPSLLLEKQSTNLALYSEQFDNASWTQTAITLTANATTSPDGTTNATSIIPTTSNVGNHRVYETGVNTVATAAYSIYVKPNGYYRVALRESNATGAAIGFDLLNETIITTFSTGGCTTSGGKIENMGNGWYRISGIFSFASATNQSLGLYVVSSSWTSGDPESVAWAGNGTSGVYLYGAQFEASSYPTSYIPTTSSSATRVADACSKTGISSLIGQTEGVLFLDVDLTHNNSGSNEYLAQIRQDSSNRILLYRSSSNSSIGVVVLNAGGTIFSNLSSVTGNTKHKVAIAYKSGDLAFYIDGVQIATNSTTFSAYSSLSAFDLGNNSVGGTPVELGDYNYNQAILFPTRLTNAELASLTTI